jgi:predicted dehydrogenase
VDGFVRAGGWLKNPSCIHVYGTHGSLRIFHYANLLFRFGPDGIRQVPLTGPASPGHFGSQLEAFIEDIRLDRSPTTPAEAGIAALEVLFAAYNEDNVATSG